MPWWNFDFTVLISSGFGGNWATADEAKNAPDSRTEFLSNMASNDNDSRSNNCSPQMRLRMCFIKSMLKSLRPCSQSRYDNPTTLYRAWQVAGLDIALSNNSVA
jgi:hypothetical protein